LCIYIAKLNSTLCILVRLLRMVKNNELIVARSLFQCTKRLLTHSFGL